MRYKQSIKEYTSVDVDEKNIILKDPQEKLNKHCVRIIGEDPDNPDNVIVSQMKLYSINKNEILDEDIAVETIILDDLKNKRKMRRKFIHQYSQIIEKIEQKFPQYFI